MTEDGPYRLELRGVTKAFPGVLANDHVSFGVRPGEIHALLGENGAGKSTLVKMIYGVLQPDAGEIRFDGMAVHVPNPKAARAMGIGMVFQHFSLFEALTVLENIALGLDEKLSHAELEKRIREVLTRYGLTLDPHRTVSTLSRRRAPAHRDRARAAPEPEAPDHGRAHLGADPAGGRASSSRRCAASRRAAARSSTSATSCTRSRSSATPPPSCAAARSSPNACPPRESSRSMAELMIGGSLKDIKQGRGPRRRRRQVRGRGPEPAPAAATSTWRSKDIRFTVRAGEILGIAGVAGNGQNELLLALSGETPVADANADPPRRRAARRARRRRPPPPRPLRRARGAQRPRRGARASRSPTTPC